MPTANTKAIIDGADFKEYALICARSFGALIHMRDEPFDAPITLPEVSDYHQKKIDEAIDLLKFLDSATVSEFEEKAREEHEENIRSYNERIQRSIEIESKYNAILEQVKKWKSPSENHDEFKEFMASQITESIQFDCSTSYMKRPVKLTGEQWRKKMLEKATKDLAYHAAELEKEQKRVQQRTDWILQLQESLA